MATETPRISLFYQHLPPFPGGASQRALSIVRGIRAHRAPDELEVHLVAGIGQPIEVAGVVSHILQTGDIDSGAGLLSRTYREIALGMLAGRRVTATTTTGVLISSPAFISALLVALWCRLKRVPYVLEVRDVYPDAYVEAGLIGAESLLARIMRSWAKTMYAGATAIITVTKGLAEAVRAPAKTTPIENFYNGFPAHLLSIEPKEKHARFTLCFHGTLGFFQDVETLKRVAARLEDHSIDVVVIGYGRKEAELAQRTPNLRFLGRLSFTETIHEVSRCHVGLCLRNDEGISRDAFPVKVWEYLGLGIPSIVTPNCEAGEFLVRNGCGYQTSAGDVDTVVAHVLQLRSDADELAAMSERCRAVSERFTRERLGVLAAQYVLDALGVGARTLLPQRLPQTGTQE
jgi:glycosyltransferase involved in cell wall biosynthesis